MTAERITANELARVRERHAGIETDAIEDDLCPDCGPLSLCDACADDERFHTERDTRLEPTHFNSQTHIERHSA